MDPMEAISEGEWSSLSRVYTTEEANFMAQLLGTGPMSTEPVCTSGSGSWPTHEPAPTLSFLGANDDSFSHSGLIFSTSSGHHENDYLNYTENGSCLVELDEHDFLNLDMPEKNIVHIEDEEEEEEDKKNGSLESSRKRSRSTGNVQKMKRNAKLKKSQSFEFSSRIEECDNGNMNNDGKKKGRVYKQSSSSCCSEDDSSVSQGQNGGSGSNGKDPTAVNLSGKTRASRGSATDPQSLYARKRRERINERLKILQNLVPNGTKVDISTMLEEAVHYVKFLQLQIKLLSSDDLWMYAPIAYNGMDIGLLNTPR